jgi:hypothetical protein
VRLASRGLRDMDGGSETITEATLAAQLRRQARHVYVQSLALAAFATAMAALLPVRS